MFISTLLAGYFLVIADSGVKTESMVVIPTEYVDKAACEQAANTVVSYGWEHLCVPSDTHVVNKEFD